MSEAGPSTKPKRAKGKAKKRRRSGTGSTSARARVSTADAALGKRFAALLDEADSHQLGVCGKLGIPWRKHMRWMSEDAEPGTPLAAYQSAVLIALDKQRKLDLDAGQVKLDGCHPAKAGPQFNMFRFRHETRFRRFYEDETAQKHEVQLTGKDGGPIETQETQVRYVMKLPPEEPEE